MFFNVFIGARMSILSHVLAHVLLAVGTYSGWFCFWMVLAHMYWLIDSISNSRLSLRNSPWYVIDFCILLICMGRGERHWEYLWDRKKESGQRNNSVIRKMHLPRLLWIIWQRKVIHWRIWHHQQNVSHII